MFITETKGSTVKVLGDSDVTYTVAVNGDGAATCSCPNYRLGGNHWCKHLRFVYATLTTEGTPS